MVAVFATFRLVISTFFNN